MREDDVFSSPIHRRRIGRRWYGHRSSRPYDVYRVYVHLGIGSSSRKHLMKFPVVVKGVAGGFAVVCYHAFPPKSDEVEYRQVLVDTSPTKRFAYPSGGYP